MHKLIYLLIPLTLGFFSCNRKAVEYTPKLIYNLPSDTLDVAEIFEPLDTLITSGSITIDTGDTNRIRFYNTGEHLHLSIWQPTLDTSDVIVTHITDWELPTFSTIVGKIVYPTSSFGIYLTGTQEDYKLFKVKDGVWIPVEWPKDIVNVYIRPKK